MALRLILFNLTLALADQGLFRKFQVSQYDLVETSKWAYTRIDCAGFCLAQPQCHGFIYEKGQTCTTITNVVIMNNGPQEAWISDSYDCVLAKKGIYGYQISQHGDIATIGDCQAKCQQVDVCWYWVYNSDAKLCFLKDENATQGIYDHEVDSFGPKFC